MWEPLLARELKGGSSLDSWRGTSHRTVFVVCDPPRHALAAQEYEVAQRSVPPIVHGIQEYRAGPLPVGLQDDFWAIARAALGPEFDGTVPDDYLANGGAGIVAAIAASSPRPRILRLERDGALASYRA